MEQIERRIGNAAVLWSKSELQLQNWELKNYWVKFEENRKSIQMELETSEPYGSRVESQKIEEDCRRNWRKPEGTGTGKAETLLRMSILAHASIGAAKPVHVWKISSVWIRNTLKFRGRVRRAGPESERERVKKFDRKRQEIEDIRRTINDSAETV